MRSAVRTWNALVTRRFRWPPAENSKGWLSDEVSRFWVRGKWVVDQAGLAGCGLCLWIKVAHTKIWNHNIKLLVALL